MTRKNDKAENLRKLGTLNRRPERVNDPRFLSDPFFDPRDLVQVRCEMLRRVSREGQSVSESARNFGVSRPTWYHAARAFEESGLAGLVPERPRPRRAHKLDDTVVEALAEARRAAASESPCTGAASNALWTVPKKTLNRTPAPPACPRQRAEDYERLRRTRNDRVAGRSGRAVLIHRGMAAWFAVLDAAPPAPVRAAEHGRSPAPELPGDVESGLVNIVAAIAIEQLNGAAS